MRHDAWDALPLRRPRLEFTERELKGCHSPQQLCTHVAAWQQRSIQQFQDGFAVTVLAGETTLERKVIRPAQGTPCVDQRDVRSELVRSISRGSIDVQLQPELVGNP